MADSMYLHWTKNGEQYGWNTDVTGKPKSTCREFLEQEFNLLMNIPSPSITRRERREFCRAHGDGKVTQAEAGLVTDGKKEIVRSNELYDRVSKIGDIVAGRT